MFRLPATALASTTSMPVMLVAPRSTLVPVKSEVSSRVSVPVPPVTVAAPAPSTKVVAVSALPVRVRLPVTALASTTSMFLMSVPSMANVPV